MTAGEVRSAGFADLEPLTAYRLWALRSAVFVVEQDCPYLDLDGRDLEPLTRHFWVEQDGVPVATLRLLDDGDALRIGRVATLVPARGQGLAARLVTAALEAAGERVVVLDAQSHLVDWYAAFGFYKLAVICEGIHYRFAQGLTVGDGFEGIGDLVAPLVSRGLDTLIR